MELNDVPVTVEENQFFSSEEDTARKLANEQAFQKDLEDLINRHCMENGSDTPDFMLAEYLMDCLRNFNAVTAKRTAWYKPAKEADTDLDPANN